ncbi:DUF664 domain-containing protein [Micromonospora sp. NPDC006431]|uniref:mycothiol transferase n=1 Tax=Micromonospora sp. NPDC006431 TaxID=3364235 RepID=UPI00369ED1FC
MRVPFPEPGPSSDVPALFLTYLDYYRGTVADRLAGLTDAQARTARVPSGWTPVELVKHLTFMERRWLVWGSSANRCRTRGATAPTTAGTSARTRGSPTW